MEWRGPTDGSKQPQGYGGREGEVEQKDQKIRKYEDRSETVIGALIEVHRALGPGLLESAYEACFCHELRLRGLAFERQRPVGISYKGLIIDCGYRVDVVIEGQSWRSSRRSSGCFRCTRRRS